MIIAASWFLEQPLFMVALGTISVVVLGFLWLQTQRTSLIYAVVAVIVLTVLGVVIARRVVTDREAVDQVLRQAARAVARNDLPGLLRHIHSQATRIRAQAEAEFPQYEFESVSIKSNLEITFDQPRDPTEATAKFNVMVIGSHRDRTVEHWRVPRYVTVTFRKEGNDWRVVDYQHQPMQEGLRQQETR